MPKQKKLLKKDLQFFEKMLLDMRSEIVSDLEHLEGDSLRKSHKDSSGDLSGYSFHMADVATDNFDTEVNLGLASNTQKILNEIDAALKRIKDGTYGVCELYGELIPFERLKVMPYARYCIKAQEEIEKDQRNNMQ